MPESRKDEWIVVIFIEYNTVQYNNDNELTGTISKKDESHRHYVDRNEPITEVYIFCNCYRKFKEQAKPMHNVRSWDCIYPGVGDGVLAGGRGEEARCCFCCILFIWVLVLRVYSFCENSLSCKLNDLCVHFCMYVFIKLTENKEEIYCHVLIGLSSGLSWKLQLEGQLGLSIRPDILQSKLWILVNFGRIIKPIFREAVSMSFRSLCPKGLGALGTWSQCDPECSSILWSSFKEIPGSWIHLHRAGQATCCPPSHCLSCIVLGLWPHSPSKITVQLSSLFRRLFWNTGLAWWCVEIQEGPQLSGGRPRAIRELGVVRSDRASGGVEGPRGSTVSDKCSVVVCRIGKKEEKGWRGSGAGWREAGRAEKSEGTLGWLVLVEEVRRDVHRGGAGKWGCELKDTNGTLTYCFKSGFYSLEDLRTAVGNLLQGDRKVSGSKGVWWLTGSLMSSQVTSCHI